MQTVTGLLISCTSTSLKTNILISKLFTCLKASSHERLNSCNSIAKGTPVTQSFAWTHSCQSWRQSYRFAATSDLLWTCSKFSNQSLVATLGSLVWTNSCWNLTRFVLPPFMKRWTHPFPIHSSWVFEHSVASGSAASNSCQSARDKIATIQSLMWTGL